VDCGEVPFPLPTNRKPSTETGAAHIICHPGLAKSLPVGDSRSAPTARPQCSLGQRPRPLSHNGLGLKARNRSRSTHCARPTAWDASFAKVLGRRPTAIKLSLEALVTRARSQAPAWECSISGGSSLLPDLQKHSAPERHGRLEPPRQGRSQAGAWERDREFLNLMAVGRCPISANLLIDVCRG